MADDSQDPQFDAIVTEAARAEGIEGEERVRPRPGPAEAEPIQTATAGDGAAAEPDRDLESQNRALVAGLDSAIRMLVGAPQRDDAPDFISSEGQLEFASDLSEPFTREYLGGVVTHPIGSLVAVVVFLLAFALQDAASHASEDDADGESGGLPEGMTSGTDLEGREPEAAPEPEPGEGAGPEHKMEPPSL